VSVGSLVSSGPLLFRDPGRGSGRCRKPSCRPASCQLVPGYLSYVTGTLGVRRRSRGIRQPRRGRRGQPAAAWRGISSRRKASRVARQPRRSRPLRRPVPGPGPVVDAHGRGSAICPRLLRTVSPPMVLAFGSLGAILYAPPPRSQPDTRRHAHLLGLLSPVPSTSSASRPDC